MAALTGSSDLLQSDGDYDWLGPGIYFWESDPVRAREWADDKVDRLKFAEPFVIGAVIDLGNCLDLLVRENLNLLRVAYDSLAAFHRDIGLELPVNRDLKTDAAKDKLFRNLDCAVIRRVHSIIELPKDGQPGHRPAPFDTVRGLFTEGAEVYPGSGFKQKTHTQIAVRNTACIKGFFRPR